MRSPALGHAERSQAKRPCSAPWVSQTPPAHPPSVRSATPATTIQALHSLYRRIVRIPVSNSLPNSCRGSGRQIPPRRHGPFCCIFATDRPSRQTYTYRQGIRSGSLQFTQSPHNASHSRSLHPTRSLCNGHITNDLFLSAVFLFFVYSQTCYSLRVFPRKYSALTNQRLITTPVHGFPGSASVARWWGIGGKQAGVRGVALDAHHLWGDYSI